MNYIDGNLIELAGQGRFNVIAHGCNCFCTMRRGIAPQMAQAFEVDKYPLENKINKGDINKLGCIEWEPKPTEDIHDVNVVNAYTQYHYNWPSPYEIPLDYDALRMCMRKINMEFSGSHVGLPKIGCGVAGGNWDRVEQIIKEELKDCRVTIVSYGGR